MDANCRHDGAAGVLQLQRCADCAFFAKSLCEYVSEHPQPQSGVRGGFRQLSLRAKDILFGEGELPGEVYRIQAGWALGYRMNSTAGRQVIGVYLPGDWISIDFVNGQPARFTCVALSDAVLCGYSVENVMASVRGEATGIDELNKLWRERLQRLENSVSMLQQTTAIERIAILVIDFQARLRGADGSVPDTFELPLKLDELARLIGLTAAHLSRTLADLRTKGVLEVAGGRIRIMNDQRLRRIAIGAGKL